MSYLYGFASSFFAYALLHKVFPDIPLNSFVNGGGTAEQMMAISREKWDDVDYEPMGVIDGEDSAKADDTILVQARPK